MEDRLDRVLDAVYAAAVAPGGWQRALAELAGAFDCHFADAFARTTDFQIYRGVVHGMDEDDYQHGLLDTWVKRNVWSAVCPVRDAGRIITTREMVEPATLRRSAMYADYLHPRGLHEGLRFDLWAGDGWVQDVSLIRSWSAGPFSAREVGAARALLPHLQRAAAIARRLQTAEAGLEAIDALGQPVFLTDGAGRVVRANRAGEALLASGPSLSIERGLLAAGTGADTARLRAIIGHAAARPGGPPGRSGQTRLQGCGEPLSVTALPVARDAGWAGLRAPSVLVMAGGPPRPAVPGADHLAAVFDLTAAEAGVAHHLAAGRPVAEVAVLLRRSVNTVRSHVARLMRKTGTRKQGALVRALLQAPPEHPGRSGPIFL